MILLPLVVIVGLAGGIGGDLRFYRTVFVEERSRDYVRAARAKGCASWRPARRWENR